MAGQHEIPLDTPVCTTCPELREISVHIQHMRTRMDELKTSVNGISDAQNTQYETVRKRIHDVVDANNHAIAQQEVNHHTDMDTITARVNEMANKYSIVAGDLSIVSHSLTEHTQQSYQNHNALLAQVDKFWQGLRDHMEHEDKHLQAALTPVKESLDGLHARWWSLAIWLVVAMGGGIVGLILYIWQSAHP